MSGRESTPRFLNACERCGRQYDVTHLAEGRRVPCECGARLTVRKLEPHSPRALRCSNCGGSLRDGASKCEYCAAEITLEELRLDAVCPSCFARRASSARFCMECGVEIAPQALFALVEGAGCPRCKGRLRSRSLGNTSITECSSCAGIWLDQDALLRLCERAEAESVAAGALSRGPLPAAASGSRQGYIPCLACGELMARKNYASTSGVIVDSCRKHGVWLDAHELERILGFVRGGGLERARERQIEKLREEQRRLRAEQTAAWGTNPGLARTPTGEISTNVAVGGLLDLLLGSLF